MIPVAFTTPERHGYVITLSSLGQKKEILYGQYDGYNKARGAFIATKSTSFLTIFPAHHMIYCSLQNTASININCGAL